MDDGTPSALGAPPDDTEAFRMTRHLLVLATARPLSARVRTPFVVPAVLVAKITDEDLDVFRARFGDGS